MSKDEIPCDLAEGNVASPVLGLVPNARKGHVKCQLRTQQGSNVVMDIKRVINNTLTYQTLYMLKKIGAASFIVTFGIPGLYISF